MEKDLNRAKQMIMYSNDAVEASYLDGSKIFLSPCASEYVVQQGSHNQVLSNKHRTIYTTSSLLPRVKLLLTFRNLFAQQPFLVPALVDSQECFQSSGTATHVRWSPNISLPTIKTNDSTRTWSWTSICGRACIEVAANRQVIFVTHPLQVSRILTKSNDENEIPTKYIHIFAPVRRCFSLRRIPTYLELFVKKCLELIERISTSDDYNYFQSDHDNEEWSFQLPQPLPSTACPKAHRHRLHNQMMLESDLHILQTSTITYRIQYDSPSTIEALLFDEKNENLVDYVVTNDIQSVFYNFYSIKDQECQLLTLSENALPPQNERLAQIIRFMSTMRQQMLTMARRVQEQPCWKEEILADELEETEHSNYSLGFDDTSISAIEDEVYRQTFILDVGHFKYFRNESIRIKFSSGFLLEMTKEQVQSCRKSSCQVIQCRILDQKKQTVIDIFDGVNQPGCYEKYIIAAIDWCKWVWNEELAEQQRDLAKKVQQELFRIKLYRNRMDIDQYQQSSMSNPTEPIVKSPKYYSPDDIKDILQNTAKFTRS